MSNILVINSGSSSLKFQVINNISGEILLKGLAEPFGNHKATVEFKYNDKEIVKDIPAPAKHSDALKDIFEFLDEHNLTQSISSIGHRVVNGGEKIKHSVLVTPEVIKAIEEAIPFAPIHNPAALLGINAALEIAPNLPQVAVFDTAFHASMPEHVYRYAVPKSWYAEHGVRRYGAHGTSYRFIVEKLARTLNKPTNEINAVIMHFGSGISAAAVKNGQSVDTTMGFTPLEGIPMATRSGDIDASVVPFIMKQENQSASHVVDILNKNSGLLGVSGLSDDTRDLEAAANNGDRDSELAIEILAYRTAKHLAGLMCSLTELDALVFTAGSGENRWPIRAEIVKYLAIFGFKLDPRANEEMIGRDGKEGLISSSDSKYPIYELITNEELMIAEDTAEIVANM